ncbi:hypothetical protein CPB83DRAFT_859812 [Crepidotus variabilis]|uniref:F-box domain-containing protein n=1 Tax=Crepidotus variabilis TaxID=179855 RepID=A0A9P6E9L2_9AGAR|nr:hypothetical protein CPB83DRAFT_859812 [Crepidotus variabilis]
MSGRLGSRIPDDLANKCHKNHAGTCCGCQKLIYIDRKIQDARRALESLLDEREELTSVLNEHHDPFAYRLPVEIVSRVFQHCRAVEPAAYTSDEQQHTLDLVKSVFSLGGVCRNWRYIVRHNPTMWSVLCATIMRSNRTSSVAMIQDWLDLSGSVPLFLQIRFVEQDDDRFHRDVQKIITSIAHHAHRWEVLDLAIPFFFLPAFSTAISNKTLHCLDHLKLETIGSEDERLEICAAPRSLTLRTSSFDEISMDFISWNKLTSVFARALCLDQTMDLFCRAPALQFCSIDVVDVDADIPSESPIICSSLHTLIIRWFPDEFWNMFSFPVLEKLHIKLPDHNDDTQASWINLQTLLRRSGCKIQVLDIEDYKECEGEVVNVLKLTPDLKQFRVGGALLRGAFFSAMNAASQPREDLHFLEKLQVFCCDTSSTFHHYLKISGRRPSTNTCLSVSSTLCAD